MSWLGSEVGQKSPDRYLGRYSINAASSAWTSLTSASFKDTSSMIEGTTLPANLQFLTVLVYNTGGSPLFILLAPAAITGTLTASTSTVITDSSKNWLPANFLAGLSVTMTSGAAIGATRTITASTSTTITTAAWSPVPAAGDTYSIATNTTTAQGIIVPPGPNPVVLPMVISAIVPGVPNTPTNIRAISVRGDTASGANAVGEMLVTFAGSYGP